MTEKQEKLIETYIRNQVKLALTEAKIIIQADGQKDALVVGGVGTTLYISQKTDRGVNAVQFSLKQKRVRLVYIMFQQMVIKLKIRHRNPIKTKRRKI